MEDFYMEQARKLFDAPASEIEGRIDIMRLHFGDEATDKIISKFSAVCAERNNENKN